jgi:hypothetical protein
MISNRVYPLSVDGQNFASTTATASFCAGNAARLATRARLCIQVLIHFHSLTHDEVLFFLSIYSLSDASEIRPLIQPKN